METALSFEKVMTTREGVETAGLWQVASTLNWNSTLGFVG